MSSKSIPYNDDYLSQIEKILSNTIKWDALFIGNGMGENFRNKKISYKRFFPINNIKVSHPASAGYRGGKWGSNNLFININEALESQGKTLISW